MRRLPPFDELVTFEAVARHLSVTRAAQELCITQSAASHRIRRLEEHFGFALIQRTNGGLALTEAGRGVLPDLMAALEHLSHLERREDRRLRVAAGSALCTWWLAGRLPAFMAQRPGVSVELAPVDSIHSPVPEVDVRILWLAADDDLSRPRQAPLFVETVFPVCSPRLLPEGRPLRDAQQLLQLPLLHKAGVATGEWSWSVWLDHLGVKEGALRRSVLSFADMSLVMSAAVDGAGVALTRSLLAHDMLAAGRLVPAVAGVRPMLSSKRHVARWPTSRASDPIVTAFIEWLVAQANVSLAATPR